MSKKIDSKVCEIRIGNVSYPIPEESLKFLLLEAHWGYRMSECRHNLKGKKFPVVWRHRKEGIEKILQDQGWETSTMQNQHEDESPLD